MKRHGKVGRHELEPTNESEASSVDILDAGRDGRSPGWWNDAFDDAMRVGLVRSISTGRGDRRP